MKRSLTTWLMLACVWALGAAASADPTDLPKLIREFEAYRKESPHSFDAYNYVPANKVGIPLGQLSEERLPEIKAKMKSLVEGYLTKVNEGNFGDEIKGIHVAIDPMVSRQFGGTKGDWLLARFAMPKGFRYLDFRKLDKLPESWRDPLLRLGCDFSKLNIGEVSPIGLFQGNYGPACRQTLVSLLKALRIDAIKYEYNAVSFPGCRSQASADFDTGAFYLVSYQAIGDARVRYFWNGSRPNSAQDLEMHHIEASVLEIDPQKTHRIWPDWKEFVKPPGHAAWKSKHFTNCIGMDSGTLGSSVAPKSPSPPSPPSSGLAE